MAVAWTLISMPAVSVGDLTDLTGRLCGHASTYAVQTEEEIGPELLTSGLVCIGQALLLSWNKN